MQVFFVIGIQLQLILVDEFRGFVISLRLPEEKGEEHRQSEDLKQRSERSFVSLRLP